MSFKTRERYPVHPVIELHLAEMTHYFILGLIAMVYTKPFDFPGFASGGGGRGAPT